MKTITRWSAWAVAAAVLMLGACGGAGTKRVAASNLPAPQPALANRSNTDTGEIPAPAKPLVVTETVVRPLHSGDAYDDGETAWGVVVKNPNNDATAMSVSLDITFLDAAGKAVGTADGLISLLPANATGADGSTKYLAGANAATMRVVVSPSSWERAGQHLPLTVTGVSANAANETYLVTGSVTASAPAHVDFAALVRDTNGKLLEVATKDIHAPAGATPFTIEAGQLSGAAKVDVIALPDEF